MSASLLLVGDSHCLSLEAADDQAQPLLLGGFLGSAPLFHGEECFYSRTENGGIRFNRHVLGRRLDAWTRRAGNVEELTPGMTLAVSLGFSSAFLYGNRMWTKWSLLGSDGRPISLSCVRAIVEYQQRHILKFIEDCSDLGLKLIGVEAPAPQLRHPAVQWMGPESVVALDSLFRSPLRAAYKRLGAEVVVCEESIGKGSLLREAYWGRNASHANVAWGRKVVGALRGLASKPETVH